MKTNTKAPAAPVARTHEGAVASKITAEQELRRLTATGMLWEGGAYENGVATAARIAALIPRCSPAFVAACAVEARNVMHLRHMPLFIVREMARGPVEHRLLVAGLLEAVIQRADELSEFLAIYWKDKPDAPISAQVKKGLARAFNKFNEYQLAKYNRDGAVRLRDVAFLTHVKPKTQQQTNLMARLVNKDAIPTHTKGGHLIDLDGFPRKTASANLGLETPDTWEVELSAGGGKDKKESWERLLLENKLGGLAFLRNLRNMTEAGVPSSLIRSASSTINLDRVLPFRFVAAARVQPQFEDMLEPMMFRALEGRAKFKGKTCLLVDISGSMNSQISAKSDLNRLDAAAALAMMVREVCEEVVIGRFDTTTELVPPRRGFALRDAIGRPRGGTSLRQAVNWANAQKYDRLIVLTDEQSMDRPDKPLIPGRGYVINIAANSKGVGYGAWNHIDGWSEGVLDYIQHFESL